MLGKASCTPAVATWLQCHTSTHGAQTNLALQVLYFAALGSGVVRSDCPYFDKTAAGNNIGVLLEYVTHKLCVCACKHAC